MPDNENLIRGTKTHDAVGVIGRLPIIEHQKMNKFAKKKILLVFLTYILSSFFIFISESKADDVSKKRIEQALELTEKSAKELNTIKSEANAFAQAGASPKSLKKAIELYRQGLRIAENPQLQHLVEKNAYLMAKAYDLQFGMAASYMRLGDNETMLRLLDEKLFRLLIPGSEGFFTPEMRAQLHVDPRFSMFIKRSELPAKMGNKSVIATPYRENLSAAQKIAGLSLFWAEARRSFVHFYRVPDLDWDAVYLEYLDRVIATRNTQEYYAVMMELAPLLQDAHTNIYAPKELYDVFYSRPAIRTDMFGDQLLVTEVRSRSLLKKIHVGKEIVAIDQLPVHEFSEKYVARYVSSSSPQDRLVRTYSYQLLGGIKNTSVQLALRNVDGKIHSESLLRGENEDIQQAPPFQYKLLAGDISYLSLDHFENADVTTAFKSAFPHILHSNGLILDLRHNGGGSTEYGLEILSYLSHQPIPLALSMERRERNIDRARENMIVLDTPKSSHFSPYMKKHEAVFDGKIVLLVGPKTFSAAEDFLVSFVSMRRGILVGSPTGGSTGQALTLNLPGGGLARICVKHDYFPDGSEFIGKGIIPDFQAQTTVEDFREGRDIPLEKALQLFSKKNIQNTHHAAPAN